MIDIETLGIMPGAVITEVAVQKFELDGTLLESFHEFVDVNESQKDGFSADLKTIKWRIENTELNWGGCHPQVAMVKLASFLGEHGSNDNDACIWANSPNFDCALLEWAFNKYKISVPWQYYQLRDLRTVMGLLPQRIKLKNTHSALEDCKNQVEHLCAVLKYLEIVER